MWAENWTGINGVPSEVVTQYSELGDGSYQVIAPDGTSYKEFYGGTGGSPLWQQGLVLQSEVWSAGVRQKWTTLNWTQDDTAVNYQTNPRVTESNVYDASGNRRRVTIDYGPYAQYGLPHVVKEYAADGVTELRHNFTDYNLGQQYLDRRIIGLVSVKLTSNTVWWETKVTYTYDDPGHLQAPPATTVQHDTSFDTSLTVRGNVTSVSRWDTTDGSTLNDPAKALTSRVGYDTNGSAVWSSDALNHQNTLSYADAFSDNINRNAFAYPTTLTDADGFATFLQYNFDFGARTRVQGPPPANQPQGLIQIFAYDSAGHLDRVTTTNNGAYTRFVYGPNYLQSFSTINTIADEAYSIQVFDGLGRVTGTATNHPGSSGGYSAQNMIYDLMGRAVKQSNPTEINGAWVPAGDDAAGWLYTQQTYDWQGRPLVTTNPSITSNPNETTTKEASYSGCGCAGGEVLTLTDEGTMDAGVFKRRQQKIYSDILGRTTKIETLNWQTGSVYSTETNSYNARDQLTLVRRYQGADSSSVYQEAIISYDGYGRLKTKHLPEQDMGTVTTWDYNPDDTVQRVTDARGASQTFSYDGRHLVTGINYAAPSGITVPNAVSFSYDAAGNRTSMTDDSGGVSYQYNQLSQMQSETRQFVGLFSSFTLNYEYNLAGGLKKITDPTSVSINYGFDTSGRLNSVSGADNFYGGVSQYAWGMSYRAWGGMKGMTYGNNYTLAASFNSRLLPTQFEVTGRPSQHGPPTVMKAQYQYYADGTLKFADDVLDERFDRAFSYDHVSMLKEAYTDAEARDFLNGTSGGTPNGPYRQSYEHDVFGHITQRVSRFWSHSDTLSASYTNNRREGFTYDADGRLLLDSDLQYVHDAAGRNISIFSPEQNRTIMTLRDGEGQVVKRTATQGSATITYYLRSSILGGKIITELNQSGQKTKGYVFAGGQLLAEQEGNSVRWRHETPLTRSRGASFADGSYARDGESDPTGVDVGLSDPFLFCCEVPSPEPFIPMLFADSGGCGINPNCVTCILDGIEMPNCDLAFSLLASGAAEIDPRGTSTSAAGSIGAMPIYGRFCVTVIAGGRVETECTTEITGYTSPTTISNSMNLRPLEPQSSAEAERIAQIADWAKRQVEKNYDNCLKRLGGVLAPGKDQAADILWVSAVERVDATLVAVTWGSEAIPPFAYYPDSNPRWNGRAYDGADVGPLQVANNDVYARAPFTSGLNSPMGTFTSKKVRFDGNPYDNLRWGARAYTMDILGRTRNRADAAGIFRAGTRTGPGYGDRVKQFKNQFQGYDDFFECLRNGP